MESSPSDNTPRLQYPSLPMGTFPWTPTSPISSQMMSSYDLMPGLVSDPSIWPLDDDLSFQPHHQQSLQHPYQQNHGVNSDSMIDSIIYSSLPTTNQPIIYNQQQQQQFIFPPTPPFNSAPTTLPMLNNSSRETTPPFSNTTNSPISQSSSTPPPGTTLVDYHPILSYPSNVQNPPIAPANNTPRRKSTGSTRTYRRRASSHPSVASVVSLTAHEPVSTIIEGIEYITFLYSHERLVKRYTVRTDVESVRLEDIPLEFRVQNAIYPRANVSREEYDGNRWDYETTCNRLGWQICWLNQAELNGRRGLIQRAVDSYRNRHAEMRSRRVARQEKVANGTLRKRRAKKAHSTIY